MTGKPHFDEEAVFGSTGEAHAGLMAAIWGPGINIAIILAMYSYRKWWGYVHAAAGAFACLYTLGTSIPILFYTGIISKDSNQNYKYAATTLNYHYLVGIACMFVIFIQTLLGVITKVMYFCNVKSMTIINMKKVHAIFGYIIVILCKSDYFIILSGDGGFWALLIQDIIFAALIIILKVKFPRMEAKITDISKKEVAIMCVQSLRQLQNSKDYAVFANYVYDIEPLKSYHPAGYEIVASVRNKEVDRYIYGMFASEELPEVPLYSHSYKSFTLVGDPIAKIVIPSTFSGFDTDQVVVKISNIKIISQQGRIYQMRLVKAQGCFSYEKYTDITQLGRYYSITLNDKVTRLYTSVNFLVKNNKSFMTKHLQGYKDGYGRYLPLNNCNSSKYQEVDVPQKTNTQLMQQHIQNYVPILFKQYESGKFTNSIITKPVSRLVLSCPKGEGLQFKHLKPGKIIIVAGGTGIYPFSDLIDLLYKNELRREKTQLSRDILQLSPILNENPFDKFSFYLMAAFNNFDDIHPITFFQIAYLTSRNKLGLTLKIKDTKNERLKELRNVKLIQNSFEQELGNELKQGLISKVWICGPPKMNENVSRFLRELYKNQQIYLIL